MPHSSLFSRLFHSFIRILIIVSVVTFMTETMTSFQYFGESTSSCEKAVQMYCQDKLDAHLDPGCFKYLSNARLRFGCTDSDCYGEDANFGSSVEGLNLTCSNVKRRPFQDAGELAVTYGKYSVLDSYNLKQRKHNVCNRVECVEKQNMFRGETIWFA